MSVRALGGALLVRAFGLGILLGAAALVGRSGYAILVKWDAQWYAGIAEHGYGLVKHHDGRLLSDYAFFPLYPLLERAGMSVGVTAVAAGLVVSWVALMAAAAGVVAVVRRASAGPEGDRVAALTVLLWCALPVALILSSAYTEGLFTALAAWALWGVLRRRWWLAGVLASLAGLTRPTGVAVVLAVLVAAIAGIGSDEPRGRVARVGAIVLAPLGLLGYLAYVGVRVGAWDGYLRVTAGWHNGIDGGVAFARWTSEKPAPALAGIVLAGVVLAALFVLAVRFRLPLPLLVYAGVILVLAVVTSGYFGSKPRYLLPDFPLLVPVAAWLVRRRPVTRGVVLGVLVLASWVYGTVWLLGAGPP